MRFTEHALVSLQESVAHLLTRKESAGCGGKPAASEVTAGGGTLSSGGNNLPISKFVMTTDPRDTLVNPVVCQSIY